MRIRYATGVVLAGALMATPGCAGCGGVGPGGDADGGGGIFPHGTTSGFPSSSSSGQPPDPVTGLVVDPASQQVDVTWGAPAPRQLQAFLVRQSGAREATDARWETDNAAIARVNNSGLVTLTAQRAGRVTLTAAHESLTATATIDVVVRADRVLPGVDPIAPAAFAGVTCAADPARAPRIVYPPHNVVLPLNLPSPLIQWEGAPASLYRVTLSGAASTISLYANGDRAQFPADLWAVLINAHSGSTLTLSVDALVEQDTCVRGASLTLKLANSDISATVYYWAVNVGQILRIDVGATVAERLNIPPEGPDANRCTACHVLSRDGSKLAFTYYGGNGPGGVVPTGTPTSPSFLPSDGNIWNFATFDPSGTRLVTNMSKQFFLRDAATGALLQPDPLPLTDVAMPTWSPDGTTLAFAGNVRSADGSPAPWEIDFDRSDLQVMLYDAQTGQVGAPNTVVAGGTDALSYPSWSPDGRFLVYQRGPHSRSQYPEGIYVNGELELVRGDASHATATALQACNPDHSGYMPTFSPFEEGGYLWLAFYSRRDYGLVIRGQHRPQIWLCAIDINPLDGVDPSHPAFWLPGQELETSNLSSYFAPVPCRGPGGPCTTDTQCCNGALCRPTPEGGSVCIPPEQACSLAGEECRSDAECCPGTGSCRGAAESGTGICSTGGNACRQVAQSCTADGDCCAGAGTCRHNDQGALVCTPGEPACKDQGDPCTKDDDCCVSAGICLDGYCGPLPG